MAAAERGIGVALTEDRLACRVGNDFIHVNGAAGQELKVSFRRTVRVVEDGGSTEDSRPKLPPDFGKFPIHKVKDYASKLPGDVVEKGGLFLAMHPREAMWIYFQSQDSFAIKVFVGETNAITGSKSKPKKAQGENFPESDRDTAEQDFVVTPKQKWLDGIATQDGRVRQFTATPSGEDYITAAEVTGLEVSNGLRFEIIPAKPATSATVPFTLTVRTPENRAVSLVVIRSDTIHIIKQQLWTKGEDVPDLQILTFEGRNLEDGRTLEDYGVCGDDVLSLTSRRSESKMAPLSPSPPSPIPLARPTLARKRVSSGARPPLLGPSRSQIDDDPAPVIPQRSESRPVSLLPPPSPIQGPQPTSGRILSPSAYQQAQTNQYSYGNTPENSKPSTPPTSPTPFASRSKTAVALTPGNYINQMIQRDPNPRGRWNTKKSISFYVHVLTIAQFTSFTALPAPTPPVTAATYASFGLPLYTMFYDSDGSESANRDLESPLPSPGMSHNFSPGFSPGFTPVFPAGNSPQASPGQASANIHSSSPRLSPRQLARISYNNHQGQAAYNQSGIYAGSAGSVAGKASYDRDRRWRPAPGAGDTIAELDATREAAELEGLPIEHPPRERPGSGKRTETSWSEMRLPEQERGVYKFRGVSTWMEPE